MVEAGDAFIESKQTFKRPLQLTLSMVQQGATNTDCGNGGVFQIFPQGDSMDSGYNGGLGFSDGNSMGATVGTDPATPVGTPGAASARNWYDIKVVVSETDIKWYGAGKLMYQATDTTYQEGPIRLGQNCDNFKYANIVVTEL